MKKTKKLLACLIAAATMFTMGSTAFAAETAEAETKTSMHELFHVLVVSLRVYRNSRTPLPTFLLPMWKVQSG